MIVIGQIAEIYGNGYPPLKEAATQSAIKHKETILKYLRSGEVTAAAGCVFHDVLTGDRIPGQATCMSDGVYGWRSDVPYYFEHYNLKLPDDFVQHVLSHIN